MGPRSPSAGTDLPTAGPAAGRILSSRFPGYSGCARLKEHHMRTALAAAPRVAAIDLNHPGTYLHWSIFEISVANLVVIAVMVVIFGAALLLPFPHRNRTLPPAPAEVQGNAADGSGSARDLGDDEDATMWTNRVRRLAVR